jgi:hypothetical protein
MTGDASGTTGVASETADDGSREASDHASESPDGDPAGSEAYRGLVGAFPYAARASDSWLFRSYVAVAAAATAGLALLFLLALITLLGATAGARFSVARAFFVLVGLGAVAPTVTPVLLVARTHRRGIDRRRGYEAGQALAGYLFLASLYLLVVAAMPETFVVDGETVTRPPAAESGAFAPLVAALYSVPPSASLSIPTAAAGVIGAVHYLRR